LALINVVIDVRCSYSA